MPGGWGGEIEFLVYAELVRHMDREQPLYGLRPRASNNDQLARQTVEEFAADFIADIRQFQPHGPYLLAGECVGGMVAYEMARQFEAIGEKVALLLLLDTDWPNASQRELFEQWERERRAEESAKYRRSISQHLGAVRGQSLRGLLRYAWHHLRPGTLARRMAAFASQRDVLAAWPRLLMAHSPKPHTSHVTLVQVESSNHKAILRRWRENHAGPIDAYVVPGDHTSYIREHAAAAAAKIREILHFVIPNTHAHRD